MIPTLRACPECGTGLTAGSDVCLACRTDQAGVKSQADWDAAWLRDRLGEFRQNQGLTQQELADQLGISQPQAQRILAGTRTMNRDLRRKIAELLGLSYAEVGLSEVGALAPDVLFAAAATVRAATQLRNDGHLLAAADALWPTLDLLLRHRQDMLHDPDLISVLVEAMSANTRIVGDLATTQSREHGLISARRAFDLARVYTDDQTRARSLIQVGNQLRICDRPDEAVAQLKLAYESAQDPRDQASAAERIARAAVNAENLDDFIVYLRKAKEALERCDQDDALVNETSLTEIETRGQLALGLTRRASDRVQSAPGADQTAPQWIAISDITHADAVLSDGEIEHGLELLESAAAASLNLHIPRQTERAASIAERMRTPAGLELALALRTQLAENSDPGD